MRWKPALNAFALMFKRPHPHVLLALGDADLVAGAADTAIRLYLGNAEAINADPVRRSIHFDRLGQAIGVAYAVHSAFDRSEPANAARAVADGAGMSEVPELATRASIATSPPSPPPSTGIDLQTSLALPAASEDIERTLFATGQRGHPEANPERGLALAKLAKRAMGTEPLVAFRVATEAHVILLNCQSHAPDRVAALSVILRPAWADMLRVCSQWVAEASPDQHPMALDIATHMSQVVADMADHAAAGRGDCAALPTAVSPGNRSSSPRATRAISSALDSCGTNARTRCPQLSGALASLTQWSPHDGIICLGVSPTRGQRRGHVG